MRISAANLAAKENVDCAVAAVISTSRRVGDHMTSKAPRTEPTLYRFLQDRSLLVRMPPTTVNHTHAAQIRPHRLENEFVQGEAGFLTVHTVQVQPCLNGKAAR